MLTAPVGRRSQCSGIRPFQYFALRRVRRQLHVVALGEVSATEFGVRVAVAAPVDARSALVSPAEEIAHVFLREVRHHGLVDTNAPVGCFFFGESSALAGHTNSIQIAHGFRLDQRCS